MNYKEFEKILKDNDIGIVDDGIGNTFIFYNKIQGNDIELGGYIDMEPFKWSIVKKWKIKKDDCRIIFDKEEYVDTNYGACQYKDGKYLSDEKYLKLILEAKDELLKVLPELKKQSDILYSKIHENDYYYNIEKNYYNKKWMGKLIYKGKNFKTAQHKNFFECKKELDEIMNELTDKDS